MSAVMSLPEAEEFAERLLAAIDKRAAPHADTDRVLWTYAADRERVASDLAGLRRHALRDQYQPAECCLCPHFWPCPDAQTFVDNLRRTGRLYGIVDPKELS